jgi:hypothetical protein
LSNPRARRCAARVINRLDEHCRTLIYQRLPNTLRAEFQELPPVEAKNIGRIRLEARPAPRSRRAIGNSNGASAATRAARMRVPADLSLDTR